MGAAVPKSPPTDTNRASLAYKLRYATRNPERVLPYLRRFTSDALLRVRYRDHVAFYRAVMERTAATNPESAVGSSSHRRWLRLGEMQFDYLVRHGLRPEHRVLEIGCGNLRAGWRLIDYLDGGNYYGTDISPDILLSAQDVLVEHGLQHKLPHLSLVRDLRLAFLPDEMFDVVHAHSVFSHSPIQVIDECLAHVGRVMRPGAFFDFTFDRTDTTEHHVLRENFYYAADTLLELARSHGFTAQLMADWEELPHSQSKIRVVRPR